MISKGWMVAGAMGAVAIASGMGFWGGVEWSETRWRADVAEERNVARAQGDKLREALKALADEREAKQEAADNASLLAEQLAKAEAELVNTEVIEYVQSPDSGDCELPNDWVRIHNQSATGMPATRAAAQATSETNAATATTVTDRDALPVITQNYARARECLTRLEGLQSWIAEAYQ